MSCECQYRDRIDVMVSLQDAGISTGLLAPVAGDYRVMLGFNNSWQKVILTMTMDELIIIPNIVNGNYTHPLMIYKPDGSLMNDTCYSLFVRSIYGSGNGLTPSQQKPTRDCSIEILIKDVPDSSRKYTLCNGDQIPLEYPSGTTLTIPYLIGKYVNRPFYMAGSVVQAPNWNSGTATWTGNFLDSGDPANPTIVTINYEQPV